MSSLPTEISKLINLKEIYLEQNQLQSLPLEIGNLINLQNLDLSTNQLQSLPAEIGNLINLEYLYLLNNTLQSLPIEILKFKKILRIDNSSYNINNLNIDNEFLIFSYLTDKLNNLLINIKEIWLNSFIKNYDIKLPFGCKIKIYKKFD